jgi:hypothetical protein
MAAVTLGVHQSNTINQASAASGTFTPAAGDLLLVFVSTTVNTTTGALTSTTGMTFTPVGKVTKNASLDAVMLFVADSFATAVLQNLTYAEAGGWAGVSITALRISGMARRGLGAIKQIAGTANAAAGTPSTSFSAAALTGNPCIGAVLNGTNPAALTPPTSWTERADDGYNLPVTGIEVATIDSGFTGPTVNWGSASASAFGVLIAEIDTSAAPANGRFYYEMLGGGENV